MISWARTMGPHVEAMVSVILSSRPHPEMGYRSCLGILRLEKRYGASRLNVACERALAVGARSYRHVDSILKNNLDRLSEEDTDDSTPIEHENIRGPDYYN
jgi:transposase